MIIWSSALITVAILLGATLILSKGGQLPSLPLVSVQPTATPVEVPTPTIEQVDRKDISIQVLNGGGVAGAASKMKTFLETTGYTVDDVGNSDDYSFEKTAILVKSGKEAYRTLLTDDLLDEYTLESATDFLDADSPYDAQVIVGKE